MDQSAFLVIALVFVFFGIGSFGDDAQVQIVVTVDDEPITLQEFQRAYRNVESNYREVYKEGFTPELAQQMNLRQQTLDQLVDAKLLAKEARRLVSVHRMKMCDKRSPPPLPFTASALSAQTATVGYYGICG